MGSPSGRRRRHGIMVRVIVLNAMSCTVPAGTLTELRSVRSGELAISGQWKVIDSPAQSRINAIHAALLPTGKVLIIAGSGNSPRHFDAGSFSTLLWDPQTALRWASPGSSRHPMTCSAAATRCCPTASCSSPAAPADTRYATTAPVSDTARAGRRECHCGVRAERIGAATGRPPRAVPRAAQTMVWPLFFGIVHCHLVY